MRKAFVNIIGDSKDREILVLIRNSEYGAYNTMLGMDYAEWNYGEK